MSEPARQPIGSRALRRGLAPESTYRIRLATSQEELRAAQTLRFLVFNLELNEGFESSYSTLRDEDPFDAICDHLLVEEVATGEVVGTYRLQTGAMAAAGRGFYSASEFDLRPFDPQREAIVELGRACVHRDHRNATVLGLLWRSIADYTRERGGRYLIGCSSLSTRDPAVGAAAYAHLQQRHLAEPCWRTVPWPQWACPLDALNPEPVRIPRLLRAYLSFGATICGPPALDREFGTVDFLTWIDLFNLPPATVQMLGRGFDPGANV